MHGDLPSFGESQLGGGEGVKREIPDLSKGTQNTMQGRQQNNKPTRAKGEGGETKLFAEKKKREAMYMREGRGRPPEGRGGGLFPEKRNCQTRQGICKLAFL